MNGLSVVFRLVCSNNQIEEFPMSEPVRKLNDVYASAKEQNKKQLCRFMRDMKRAGHRQRYFEDRVSWSGPPVLTDDVRTVLSETTVPCLSVPQGTRFLVHP